MTRFDKLCAILTIPTGAIFIIAGILGFFGGMSASGHIELPPIFSVIPLILGWSMCVTLFRVWRRSKKTDVEEEVEAEPRRWPSGPAFTKFLSEYPEFKRAPKAVLFNAFQKWLEKGGGDPQEAK